MTRTVLITGATAGIGEACAQLFAAHQYRLILTGRRKDRLDKLSQQLMIRHDVAVRSLVMDVRNRKAVSDALESLPDPWKEVDVLINNAGLCLGLDPLQLGNPDDWDTMIDTNIKGLLYVTRTVSQWMVKRNSGHIINLGSIAAKETYPNGNIYCATKHAVDSLSKAMRIDLLPCGVKVTAIHPGPAETEFSQVRFKGDLARAKKVYEGYQALTAQDIAETIWFAVSRPAHVNISDLLIMPAAQATATIVHRKSASQ